MSELVVFEGELERASRDVGEVGAELANPRLDECRAAEDLAMPGGSQADLSSVMDELESFIRDMAKYCDETSEACYLAAKDLANTDEDFAAMFDAIRLEMQ
ncbi:hypothetical protein [uncultured Gulosibacter sp.]|uniref:hypothetical protein n=1 Tax=uncultured Gulosibacter sp. TaxID=1339167 RepID=UPI00288A22E1|nr:hypothetical protein [uncultured Gulosibacter sp.]